MDNPVLRDEEQCRVDRPPASMLHAAVLSGQRNTVREIFTTYQWSCMNLFNRCLVMMLWPFRMMNRPFKFDILHWMMVKMDDEGMCAIHVAVKLGYCDIIEEFLSIMPECVYIRSKDYKTPLHVAIQHNQLEVVQKLLENKKKKERRNMVSSDHDLKGNTAFHIAAKKKVQPQIVEELLRRPGVNVNVINMEGATPLDIALHFARTEAFPDNSHSVEIQYILENVGACRSNSMQLMDKESKTLEVDTLVASLITTITFAAIFQVPGGIEDEKEAQGGKSPIQFGAAKLALDPYFKVFLFCDVAAFFTSLTVVLVWLHRERLQNGSSFYGRRLQISKRLRYLSALSLVISVSFASIAFLCAAFLVVIPPHVKNIKTTHEKEFGEYKGLYSIMKASFALPFSISMAVAYFWFFSDYISRRLRNPSPIHYNHKIGVFVLVSLVMSCIVTWIFDCLGEKYFGK